jgi:hypothetical protein
MQAILEKFEFFPIKCRSQRAFEIFKMKQSDPNSIRNTSSPFKIKVETGRNADLNKKIPPYSRCACFA